MGGPGRLSEPIFITGLGTLGAWGSGSRRASPRPSPPASPLAVEVDRAAGYHRPGRRAAAPAWCPPGALAGWLSPAESRRMSPPSKLAVAASRMALRCAGLGPEGEEPGTPGRRW